MRFFSELGVALHEEPGGKLFPDSNRARDVVDALLRGVRETGVELRAGVRVHGVARDNGSFTLDTSTGPIHADAVVLATGGCSLPKTGSDGGGYVIAQSLGHTIVAPTPALAPLLLAADTPHSLHAGLSGCLLYTSPSPRD